MVISIGKIFRLVMNEAIAVVLAYILQGEVAGYPPLTVSFLLRNQIYPRFLYLTPWPV